MYISIHTIVQYGWLLSYAEMPLVTLPALGGSGSRQQAPGGPSIWKVYVFAGQRESIEELEHYLGQTSVTL